MPNIRAWNQYFHIYNSLFDSERSFSAKPFASVFCVEDAYSFLYSFWTKWICLASFAIFAAYFRDRLTWLTRLFTWSTNCSRRPIFKAADEFLHHYTRSVERKRKSSDRILDFFLSLINVWYMYIYILHSFCLVSQQPVQAFVHIVCKYSIFNCNAKFSVFQSIQQWPLSTKLFWLTNLVVNAFIKSHKVVFSKQHLAMMVLLNFSNKSRKSTVKQTRWYEILCRNAS